MRLTSILRTTQEIHYQRKEKHTIRRLHGHELAQNTPLYNTTLSKRYAKSLLFLAQGKEVGHITRKGSYGVSVIAWRDGSSFRDVLHFQRIAPSIPLLMEPYILRYMNNE